MTGRAFVLIFFFWALLTIITPTLIILSASENPNFDPKGEQSGGSRPRKMMGCVHGEQPIMELEAPAAAPAPAPVPADISTNFTIQMAHLKFEQFERRF